MDKGISLTDLLELVESLALEEYGGHFTIFKFTTGWKVMLGTPNLDTGDGRKEVQQLKPGTSLRQGLFTVIKDTLKLTQKEFNDDHFRAQSGHRG